jgi:ribonucleoside-diphosphate reductase alpha chain
VSSSGERTTRPAPESVSDSVEADAKERAVAVVKAWRAVDFDAAERGDVAALDALRSASEMHESARRFLLDEAGGVGVELDAGLERYYSKEIGGRLRRPALLAQLAVPAEALPAPADDTEGTLVPRPRPTVTTGHTMRMNTGCGNLYVTINEDKDGQPFELFNHMGKAGGCAASQNEAIGRLISYALRCGASMEPLIKQLKGISCHRPAWGEDGKISSCSDAIGKALEKYFSAQQSRGRGAGTGLRPAPAGTGAGTAPLADGAASDLERRRLADLMSVGNGHGRKRMDEDGVQGACQDCGSQLSYEEGCVKCHSCGFTECG